MRTRNIREVLVMLLVILVVIFLWRQGEYGDSFNNESRIALRYSPR